MRRTGLIISLMLFVLVGAVFWQRQNLYDWYRLRDYQPSAEIAALADNTTMLPKAERIFYVQHPQLNNKEEFNQHCNQTEQTIVLGCYISNLGIYLYDITDERLKGIEEVTAAHEMLHAAYDRLSGSEKSRIDTLLNRAFEDVKDDRIRQTIDNYRKNDADITNELHSILGTEVRTLPGDLEQYYQRYFSDRNKIVKYSQQYESVFVKQQQRIEDLAERIDAFEATSQAERKAIDAEAAAVRAEAERMDQLRAAGRTNEYNAAVPAYNAQANVLNNRIAAFNASLATYRSLVNEYNALAQSQRDLNAAIDSRISTSDTR